MIDAWQSTGEAFLLAPGLAGCAESGALLDLAQRNELRNIAAHGVRGTSARGLVGFYGFSRISGELGPSVAYRAELVLPYLHATYLRVLACEPKAILNGSRAPRQITAREAEILRWIKAGKTNVDIARTLELSPWTVKNHVQTILKKLSAQMRTHAVARAIGLGILDSAD